MNGGWLTEWGPVIVAVLALVGVAFNTLSARKGNKETNALTGLDKLVAALEKRVNEQDEELQALRDHSRKQDLRIDKLERREQVMIRWARAVVTWYNVVLPHLEGTQAPIPPFPPPPPGVETAYGESD